MENHDELVKSQNSNITVATLRRSDWSDEGICENQENYQELKKIRDRKIAPLSQALKSYWMQRTSQVLEERLLESDYGSTPKMYQKTKYSNRFTIYIMGLREVTKTLQEVQERFYYVNCLEIVKEWCYKRATCSVISNGPRRGLKTL